MTTAVCLSSLIFLFRNHTCSFFVFNCMSEKSLKISWHSSLNSKGDISHTKDCVLTHFQTWGRALKKRRSVEYFFGLRGVGNCGETLPLVFGLSSQSKLKRRRKRSDYILIWIIYPNLNLIMRVKAYRRSCRFPCTISVSLLAHGETVIDTVHQPSTFHISWTRSQGTNLKKYCLREFY